MNMLFVRAALVGAVLAGAFNVAWATGTGAAANVAGLGPQPTAAQLAGALATDQCLEVPLDGQSNMAGRGVGNASIDVANWRVKQWDEVTSDTNYQTWIDGKDPLYMEEGVETGLSPFTIGPGNTFAQMLARSTAASGATILEIPSAVGSTAMVNGPWSPTAGGTVSPNPGYLYYNAYTQQQAATTAAYTQLGCASVAIAATLMAQGETDAVNGTGVTGAAYAAAADAFITGQRTNMTGGTNSPFLWLPQQPYYVANYQDGQVVLAQMDLPRRDYYSAYVTRGDGLPAGFPISATLYCSSSNACSSEGVGHYSAQGQRELGFEAFLALPYAQANYLSSNAPLAPTGLSAPGIYATAIHLQWKQPLSRFTAAAVRYQVVGASGWTPYTIAQGTVNDLAAPYGDVDVLGLTAGTPYNFQVAMTNENGQGPWSATFTATTNATLLNAPADPLLALTASSPTSTGATTNWLNGWDGETPSSYSILYRPDGIGASYATVSGITAPPYTITGAAYLGTLYDVVGYPANSIGLGPVTPLHAQFTTAGTQTAALAPGTVTATTVAGGAAEALNWIAPSGGYPYYNYTMRACPHGSTTGCVLQQTAVTGSAPSTSGTINGLTPATPYDFTVAADNYSAGGSSLTGGTLTPGAYSAITTATTGSFSYLQAATGATPYASCDIDENEVSGETGNLIEVENSAGTTFEIGTVNNLLNTAALVSDAAGGNLYIDKCYDQVSGRSVTLGQGTLASMPLIVSNGTVITDNGEPAFETNGSNDYLSATTPTGFPGASNFSIVMVMENPTTITAGSNDTYLSALDSVTAFGLLGAATPYYNAINPYAAAGYISPEAANGSFTAGTPHVLRLSCVYSTKTCQEWVDGTQTITNGVFASSWSMTEEAVGAWPAHATGLSIPNALYNVIDVYNAAETFSATDAWYTYLKPLYGTN